jgi:heptosyltransferase-2
MWGAPSRVTRRGLFDRAKQSPDHPSSIIHHPAPITSHLSPKRILVIRLDRLGDVVLSTPVLQALRWQFSHAFIAMMVRPACEDIVRGNPYINDVIVYEKENAHRSVWGTIRFAKELRRYRFDTALALHPSNRSHVIPWLAGIPVRIGYDRKSAWLLTHRLKHYKQEGKYHEALYTLECLRLFGIAPDRPQPFVPIQQSAARAIERLFAKHSIQSADRLVAIHPSASCVSKRWMPERFAQVADRLIAEQALRVCVVAADDDARYARQMLAAMRQRALDFSAQLSVSRLAALLARCRLLISNDSGPVHVAAAVGTPVVDIFGRNQRGLSWQRWGPLGDGHVVLHKEVGCVTCLAHNCDIGFLCLTALSQEEVYQAAVSVLRVHP